MDQASIRYTKLYVEIFKTCVKHPAASIVPESLAIFQPAHIRALKKQRDQLADGHEGPDHDQRVVRDGYGHQQECHSTFVVFPFLGKNCSTAAIQFYYLSG
jgi:hypothetical protein